MKRIKENDTTIKQTENEYTINGKKVTSNEHGMIEMNISNGVAGEHRKITIN